MLPYPSNPKWMPLNSRSICLFNLLLFIIMAASEIFDYVGFVSWPTKNDHLMNTYYMSSTILYIFFPSKNS